MVKNKKRIVLYYPQQRADCREPPFCRLTQDMPIALLAIAAWPIADGFEVKIIDGTRYWPHEAHQRVVEACEGALLYATTGILGHQITDGLICSQKVKERHPHLPLFMGGWFASTTPEMQLRTGLYDAVAIGQGEITFREIVQAVHAGEPLDDVHGLALMRDGKVYQTPERKIAGWDRILNLPWHLIDPELYLKPQLRERDRGTMGTAFGPGRPRFEISYFASYGCPHACTFCCSPRVTGRGWKAMPAERMLDDLAELKEQWGFDGVSVLDANYGVKEERSRKVAEGMLNRGLHFSYYTYCEASSLLRYQPSTLDLMAESGMYGCVLGGEAGCAETLDRIKKPSSTEDTLRAGVELEKRGMSSLISFMIGYPGETSASMYATLDQARRVAVACPNTRVEVWPFRPLPGTEEYDRAIRAGFRPPASLEEWGLSGDYWTDQAWPESVPKDVAKARRIFMFYSSIGQGRVRQKNGFWEKRARQRLRKKDFRFGRIEASAFHWCEKIANVLRAKKRATIQ
jgi:radical SAM superfamily enzyme YgiQ (UPF0313 family)